MFSSLSQDSNIHRYHKEPLYVVSLSILLTRWLAWHLISS